MGECFKFLWSSQNVRTLLRKHMQPSNSLSFYMSQNVLCRLSQSKNLIAFMASSKTFVAAQKNKFAEWKSSFGVAQNVYPYLAWSKFFGILGLVEGRSINFYSGIRNLSLITYPDHRYWRRERSHKRGCLTQWHIQQVPFKRYYGQKQGWNYANSFSESSSKLQIDEWQQIPLQHHSFPERWRIFVRVSPFFSIW